LALQLACALRIERCPVDRHRMLLPRSVFPELCAGATVVVSMLLVRIRVAENDTTHLKLLSLDCLLQEQGSKKSRSDACGSAADLQDAGEGSQAEVVPETERLASNGGAKAQADPSEAKEPNLESLRQEARQAMHRIHTAGVDEQE
jgi:hypothetical protein